MYYLTIFFITTFLTAWLNAKFINDSSGVDQYWHISQLYQQVWIWIAFGLVVLINRGDYLTYAIYALSYGLMYMFIYNSTLNVLRLQYIDHLGSYDKFNFGTTVILFLFGLAIIIIKQLGLVK